MLKFIFSLIMIFPLFIHFKKNSYWMFHNMIFFISFFFIVKNLSIYYWSSISYFFGVDFLSNGMILLSFWICGLMLIASGKVYFEKFSYMFFIFLVLSLLILLILTFCSMNFLMFYIFFESTLIPTIFLILGWGFQPERLQAGLYLLFYTLFASLPLLLSIFILFNQNFSYFFNFLLIDSSYFYYYNSFLLAFLVKIPLYLFHLWLPKAHVEAPVSGSMILAGVLLKLGGYGLIRIFPIIMKMISKTSFIWISIGLFGGFLISLVCLIQLDLKMLIAYSSIVHMGLMIGGLMTFTSWGLNGSLLIMIAHGLCSSGLFCLVNINYERIHSRSIIFNKGFLNISPLLSMWWFMFSASNMACPPTLNLLGEISLFNSIIMWSWICIFLIILISFFSAAYSIYLYSITQHGKISSLSYSHSGIFIREYLLLFLHWFPLNLLILKIDLFFFYI